MRKEKTLLLDEIKAKFKNHSSFVLVSYKQLKANDANKFRRQICKGGSDFEVLRKKMFLKAANDLEVGVELAGYQGHLGIAFTNTDSLELAKSIIAFSNANEKVVEVLGGLIDGKLYSGKEVEALSKLPGKDEMRAQLLGLFEAPMAQTLSVMEALVASVVYCLDNKIKKES